MMLLVSDQEYMDYLGRSILPVLHHKSNCMIMRGAT